VLVGGESTGDDVGDGLGAEVLHEGSSVRHHQLAQHPFRGLWSGSEKVVCIREGRNTNLGVTIDPNHDVLEEALKAWLMVVKLRKEFLLLFGEVASAGELPRRDSLGG